jgi:hypothetical protein
MERLLNPWKSGIKYFLYNLNCQVSGAQPCTTGGDDQFNSGIDPSLN